MRQPGFIDVVLPLHLSMVLSDTTFLYVCCSFVFVLFCFCCFLVLLCVRSVLFLSLFCICSFCFSGFCFLSLKKKKDETLVDCAAAVRTRELPKVMNIDYLIAEKWSGFGRTNRTGSADPVFVCRLNGILYAIS